MKKQFLQYAMLCSLVLPALPAAAGLKEFSFSVIAPPHKSTSNEPALREAIEQTDGDDLAFVVAIGIKSVDEPCTDKVYSDKKALLHAAKNNMIVSLAATDWARCSGRNGKLSAIGRLGRLRDLFFADEFSSDDGKIKVVRQSATAKFRSYAENARWEVGNVMFATINLPSNNNHYVSDAGRNSEFEDRLIANRDWLHRVYSYATRKKLAGIVLFCDGNPLSEPESPPGARDGFAETRRYLAALSASFPGKILVVHSADEESPGTAIGITWHGNVGSVAATPGATRLTVNPSSPTLFTVISEPTQMSSRRP